MPNYRRVIQPGGAFFFTVFTAGRRPLFRDDVARRLLGDCLREERADRPFVIDAVVLLPDHLHAIWSLPAGDSDYSTRWASIKARFTRRWLAQGGPELGTTTAQAGERRRGIWQPRYLEHTIRDEDDFLRHADYIHFNPVKHGLVSHPGLWPWSTFHRYVRLGYYPPEWAEPVVGLSHGRLDAGLLE